MSIDGLELLDNVKVRWLKVCLTAIDNNLSAALGSCS